jgi:hypothetical protein
MCIGICGRLDVGCDSLKNAKKATGVNVVGPNPSGDADDFQNRPKRNGRTVSFAIM